MRATLIPARDGRGRSSTGPSASRPPARAALLFGVVFVAALAAGFAFGTEARRTASPETLALVAGLAAALGCAITAGSARAVTSFDARRAIVSFALGAVAFTLAPYVVMLHRYSDAPPGSEVLFFTTAGWGALLALGLALVSGATIADRFGLLAGALLGLAGVAGVVANWERPSSFSPFFRYVPEELWFLVAGVAVAALWWWLAAEHARGALTPAALAASGGAVASAVALALHRAEFLKLGEVLPNPGGLMLYGASVAVATSAALALTRAVGARGVAATYLLPAAALTLLTYIEQATTSFGPQPILLWPAAAGSVAALAAAVLIALLPGSGAREVAPGGIARGRGLRVGAFVLTAVAAVLAVVAFFLPAVQGHASGLGSAGETLDVRFDVVGAESVAGWAALALALAALSLGVRARVAADASSHRRGSDAVVAASLLAACATWPLLRDTPLRTLTSFIPSEIQVDFGSEFASITYNAVSAPVMALAVGCTALALALLLIDVVRFRARALPGEQDSECEAL